MSDPILAKTNTEELSKRLEKKLDEHMLEYFGASTPFK